MNNREKATLIWFGVLLLWMLVSRELRESLFEVLKALVHPVVLGCLLLLAGWTVGLVVLAHQVSLWESDVRNDTVTWFLTVGFGFFMSMGDMKKPGYFGKVARRAVGITAFIEVFVNLAVFGLIAELILLPVVVFLVMMAAVAETNPEHAPALKVVNFVLGALGILFFIHVGLDLADDLQAEHTLRALILPAWLTVGALPPIYVVGLYSEYQRAFIRIDIHADDPKAAKRAKWALLKAANVSIRNLGGFTGHWIYDVSTAEFRTEAREVLRVWKRTWRQERYEQNFRSAQSSVQDWLDEDDAAIADIHLSMLTDQWDELDHLQRAEIKVEALTTTAKRKRFKAVTELPE